MRKPSILLCLVLASLILARATAWACGDKLILVMGSSQLRALHPAAILVYPGQSADAALIRSLQSQPAFKKAGYRLQLVEDSAGLDNALRDGKYDVVVADVSDANELSRQVSLAASKAVLLPVAFKASKEEQSAALKKYHCLLKAPSSPDNYLDAIDHAMELKLKGAKR
jgi:ABC-type amino acid transport substrate-binding protein